MKIHDDTQGPESLRWEDAIRAIMSNPLAGARVTETWMQGMVLGAGITRVNSMGTNWGQRAAAIQECYRGMSKMDAVAFMSDGEVRRVTPEVVANANETLRNVILKEASDK